ncbi:hypothetical protein BBK82_30470 [Lentzea guizhouensis]|uniref:MobA-like NTP transferase domain-containing protein n=1 Tax=Lentzea guizhouensis TaxID=1586287 RepID=A0A1B2HPS6_9PSEU|nr:NTP transferase domain-containing protein [Lentzea guizhouensis]ANZ39726.1 hypothetical protein BBK82_30470 [Lentzea guizhouensis]
MKDQLTVVVLAAGGGRRMKSAVLPKVMHAICGRPLLGHVVAAARELDPEHLVVVVGVLREHIKRYLAESYPETLTVDDNVVNGTGLACRTGLDGLVATGVALDGTVLVLNGDSPLCTADTLRGLVDAHRSHGNAVTVLTAVTPDPGTSGRILRSQGEIAGIVEHGDATPEQLAITEVNSGVYAFDAKLLPETLLRIRTDNSQGEEYLTDAVEILRGDGRRVGAWPVRDHREIMGVNDRKQLAEAWRVFNNRLVDAAMRDGVTVVDPFAVWLDVMVTYEPDAVLHPNTHLRGATHIGAGAVVGRNCTLTDTVVGAGARLSDATARGASISPGAVVGPYTHLVG